MLVDTDMLRMGADFSKSASEIAKRGADEFASTSLPAGLFGDFEAAHGFHSALCRAHEAHAETMRSHHADLDGLAAKANIGAAEFDTQDEACRAAVCSAGDDIA
ncbi:hypothetical protein A5765_08805 [Mycolicibacterium celeriflavum]|uniref:Uncharacterized protein n=1 Tax=Mycolicibacterium celeriflavum TaxID=1249101 RepID=A0A1X0BJW5_MYCCF|nr:DUF2563 family protein [Mycolicibacterium celeriflavum]MCV7236932.1 DUF2563 family protein [Mycolicibacterium celeriflavum]OBG15831.1 hypothetical protein A5765_08805 [Mycolicibacterium celeriflavum]ORA42649.1 hypothetical protein BST21_23180 [Mycolicibacterium celeriflavum]BBY45499.1 hypothetical protein MCEL_37940 [Mycolicibacterium celeriflavum]